MKSFKFVLIISQISNLFLSFSIIKAENFGNLGFEAGDFSSWNVHSQKNVTWTIENNLIDGGYSAQYDNHSWGFMGSSGTLSRDITINSDIMDVSYRWRRVEGIGNYTILLTIEWYDEGEKLIQKYIDPLPPIIAGSLWCNHKVSIKSPNNVEKAKLSFQIKQTKGKGKMKVMIDDLRINDEVISLVSPENGFKKNEESVSFNWKYDCINNGCKLKNFRLCLGNTQSSVLFRQGGLIINAQEIEPVLDQTQKKYLGKYEYNGIEPGEWYYWQVEADVENEKGEIELIQSGIRSFRGKLKQPVVVSKPSDLYISPDPSLHKYNSKESASLSFSLEVPNSIKEAIWFKNDDKIAELNNDDKKTNPGYDILLLEKDGNYICTLKMLIEGMDNNQEIGVKFKGNYSCKIITSEGSEIKIENCKVYIATKPHGLIHRWSFNGTLQDSVGMRSAKMIDPSLPGNIILNEKELVFDPGFDANLSGQDNAHYIDLGPQLISSLGKNCTFMFWFKRIGRDNKDWQMLLNCNNGATGTSSSRFSIVANQLKSNIDIPGAGNDYICYGGFISDNEYHSVAVVLNNKTNKQTIYLDGVKKNSFQLHDLAFIEDDNCWLGRSNDSSEPLFAGSIDEFRIYDIALNDVWIKAFNDAGPDKVDFDLCLEHNYYDINNNCVVDVEDYAAFAENWLASGFYKDLIKE